MYAEKPNLRKNYVLQHEGEKHIKDVLQDAPDIQLFEKLSHKIPPPRKLSLSNSREQVLFNNREVLNNKHLHKLTEITPRLYNTVLELSARFRFHGT